MTGRGYEARDPPTVRLPRLNTLAVRADDPMRSSVLVAIPFILFCAGFVVIGFLRAPRTAEPLPSLGMLGIQLLRIQVIGFVAALVVAFFADDGVAIAVFLVGQAWAALTLLFHGLNVVLSRR
jgi:hypothetical protein